jgi:preprotein translocase subunit SecB
VQPSPLFLKNYFVTRLLVEANRTADLSKVEGQVNTTTQLQPAQHNENKRDWRVTLKISCTPTEPTMCCYLVEIELVGFFEVHKSINEKDIADLVIGNGPAILYGAAREIILLVTGRGPFPPFSLPSATFIDDCPSSKRPSAQVT